MPIQKCQRNGKSGYKSGPSGKCFLGPDAKSRAGAQSRAIKSNRYENDEVVDFLSEGFADGAPQFVIGRSPSPSGRDYKVQAVIFQDDGRGVGLARKWLKDHGFKSGKLEELDGKIVAIQADESQFAELEIIDAVPLDRQMSEYSKLLTRTVSSKTGGDRQKRADLVKRVAEGSGMATSSVNQVLAGGVKCPTAECISAFAKALDISVDSLKRAAGRDGCELAEIFQEVHVDVPMVIGHEDDQALLERSDIPRAGKMTKLWRAGVDLLSSWEEVPEVVADVIGKGAFNDISVEIYDPFEYQGEEFGMALRRVALLGGELPQVKTLDLEGIRDLYNGKDGFSIPRLKIFEAGTHREKEYTEEDLDEMVMNFGRLAASEERPELQVAFAENGPGVILDLRRSQELTEYGRNSETFNDEENEMPTHFENVTEEMFEALNAFGIQTDSIKSEDIAPFVASVVSVVDDLRSQIDTAAEEMNEIKAKIETEGDTDTDAGDKTADEKFEEAVNKRLDLLMAPINKRLEDMETASKERLDAEQAAAVKAFCESRVDAKKILPSEMDDTDGQPNLEAVMFAIASTPKVHKFSDKSEDTALKALMNLIDRREPLSIFSEKLKGSGKGGSDTSDEAQVREYYRTNSEAFSDFTEDEFVKTFKESGQPVEKFIVIK